MKLKIIVLVLGLFCHNALAASGVATAHPIATAAGIKMLELGGNAFDAAIAITATLAVVEPASSGMGGGGFWLLYDADQDKSIMLDGREKAPLAATHDMYLDEQGNVVPNLSISGALAAGIPGQPAALVWLGKHYGALPLRVSLQPAIDAATNGFEVGQRYRKNIEYRIDAINAFSGAAEIFLIDGKVPEIGARIVQNDLAKTLRTLAVQGHDGFYAGDIAEKLVQGVKQSGGIWSLQDLAEYQVAVRQPVVVEYNGMTVTSAALPSSGGLVLAESLNILSNYDIESMDDVDFTHVTVEAMRRAYRDRAEYMGDTDFVEVPTKMLNDRQYANGLNQSLRMDRATPSAQLAPTWVDRQNGQDTTHFSVVDDQGNRVAATLSINYPFGSGVAPTGTGVLLNDEMDDFSAKPGQPNVYGLVGARANAIEPGKRMLSSMSPTFLETANRIAVLGTPGGSRIISMVLLSALKFHRRADTHSINQAIAQEIVGRPRYHHQYLPDVIQYEPGALSEQTIAALEARGHKFKPVNRKWGNMQVVIVDRDSGEITAASDGRGEGQAKVLP
ncbi:gamma-glutamyltransferase [Candidatus Spongiihabitans sp.]|uniref:gamma-glutamyltransferase n=1 Tax=Candidatus Spongiihabitans sp. TaxID=3101308 RepID=UPI003C6FDB56